MLSLTSVLSFRWMMVKLIPLTCLVMPDDQENVFLLRLGSLMWYWLQRYCRHAKQSCLWGENSWIWWRIKVSLLWSCELRGHSECPLLLEKEWVTHSLRPQAHFCDKLNQRRNSKKRAWIYYFSFGKASVILLFSFASGHFKKWVWITPTTLILPIDCTQNMSHALM